MTKLFLGPASTALPLHLGLYSELENPKFSQLSYLQLICHPWNHSNWVNLIWKKKLSKTWLEVLPWDRAFLQYTTIYQECLDQQSLPYISSAPPHSSVTVKLWFYFLNFQWWTLTSILYREATISARLLWHVCSRTSLLCHLAQLWQHPTNSIKHRIPKVRQTCMQTNKMISHFLHWLLRCRKSSFVCPVS